MARSPGLPAAAGRLDQPDLALVLSDKPHVKCSFLS